MSSTDSTMKLKQHSAVVKQESGARMFTFTLSSGEVDRDGDIINQEGIDLKEFRKNPVVLWAHDSRTPPIGRVKSLFFRDKRLHGTVEFAPEGASPLSDEVHDLVAAGFLSAVSIGFRAVKFVFNDDHGGFDFEEIELQEVSIVPVPSNREALLADDKRAKIIRKWAKEFVGYDDDPKPDPKPDPLPGPAVDFQREIADLSARLALLEKSAVSQPEPMKAPRFSREAIEASVQLALTESVREEMRYLSGQLDT